MAADIDAVPDVRRGRGGRLEGAAAQDAIVEIRACAVICAVMGAATLKQTRKPKLAKRIWAAPRLVDRQICRAAGKMSRGNLNFRLER